MKLLNSNSGQGLVFAGGVVRYTELEEQIPQFVDQIKPRSLVFALCRNTVGSVAGYVAFVENGIVPVMLDATMDRALLDQLIETYGPAYLFVPIEQQNEFSRWSLVAQFYDYVLLKNPQQVNHQLHPDLALLLTTSGSTGSPKLVRLTYKNIEANARSIAQYLGITANELPITSLPMHYSYGLSVINSHLIQGATILLTDHSVVSKEFWQFFKAQKATSIAGVPYTYQIFRQFRLLRQDLPSLKTLTQAGGKLSGELVAEFADWATKSDRRFFVMYGQTEATARMSYLPVDQTLQKNSSIGIAIPGGEFSLVDTQGAPIEAPNVAGELLYRGDNVSMGYAETIEDMAKGDENFGLLQTGDVAQRDQDGFYYIVGRLKRFIKVFGNRVNLDQAEQLAKQIAPDVACTGVDDKLTIHITDSAIADQVKQHIVQKTGLHPSAIAVNVVVEIPKNSSGKTQYSLLQ